MLKVIINFLIILVVAVTPLVSFSPQASAVTAADWKAGRIIDDVVFTDGDDMSVADIQAFLNARVPVCDNWGTKPSGYGGTRAEYATSRGYSTPFTCLKEYYEVPKTTPGPNEPASNYGGNPVPAGAISAAQIISNAAMKYSISPKALLVKLATESPGPLTSDDWPFKKQYLYAMGAHCPDSGPGGAANCDVNYSGFSLQMDEAAALLRWYLDSMTQPWWQYKKPYQVNSILWNVVETGCGAGNVFIESKATAALYTYTPYQPNNAALTNMYGTGDGCSAYGNRNFWRVWSDWFGSTVDNRLFYRVIQGDASGEVYLQTSVGKYYVPSYSLLEEWGLGPSDVQVVPQAYVNSIPFKNSLSNTLTDGSGNLFVVEGRKLHQVTSPSITGLWNLDTANMVESLGLSNALSKKEPLGRFITLSGGDGSIWLIDGAKRHKVENSMLYSWGYYPGITNSVSSNLFNRYIVADQASQYASPDNGSTVWAIEASTKRPFKDGSAKNAYVGISPISSVGNTALSFLHNNSALTRFAYNTANGQWFMIDNGKKYYVPNGELVSLWGKAPGEALTPLSTGFLESIPSNGNLTYTAQSANPSAYWLIAKTKHYIPSSDINSALSGSTNAPTLYSDELINSLPQAGNASAVIRGSSSPYNYAYILDKGKRRHPSTSAARDAWVSNVLTVPNELTSIIPEGSFIQTVVKDENDIGYYIEAGKKHPIEQSYSISWGVSSSTPRVDSSTLARLEGGNSLTDSFTVGNASYMMSNGKRLLHGRYKDAYPSSLTTATALRSLGDTVDGGTASYLVKSSDVNDQRTWLINKGSKMILDSFEKRVALGYLSNNVAVSSLAPATLDSITNSQAVYSNLIQKGTSGIKFVNFGHAMGFPDSPTLIAYTNNSTGVLNVSDSIYDSFTLRKNTSRLIYDDIGRHFWMENGQKRYINTWTAYYRDGYPKIESAYLQGTTMNLIPSGPQID